MTWINPPAECFPQILNGHRLITIGCLRIEYGWRYQVEYVMDNGEKMYLSLPSNREQWPQVHHVYEWNGTHIAPSEATWDQLVDQMPIEARVRHRGRICLDCAYVVDCCSCGCCPEARG